METAIENQAARAEAAADMIREHGPQIHFKDPENPTLSELVWVMNLLDEGLVEFDAEKHAEIVGAQQVKVDNYKRFIDTLELETERIDREIEERTKYKKRLGATAQRLKDLLLHYHELGQLLPGKEYQVKVRKSQRTVAKVQPNDDIYYTFPELIRTKMEWKLTEVKAALKDNPDSELANFVEVVESKSLSFAIRKGVEL